MAISPLLDLLPAAARVFFPQFVALAETDLSASAILRQLQGMGLSLRRQTGLDLIGALRDNVNAARQFRLIADSVIPDPSKFGTAVTDVISNYYYKVKLHNAPQDLPSFITVASNNLLSKAEIKSTAAAYLANTERYRQLDLEEDEESPIVFEVVDALKSAEIE
jgi:hypothetical protein